MTEAEWLACDEPTALLATAVERGTPVRKVRLFYAGCCRAVWDRIRDSRIRKLIELGERVADGEVKADLHYKPYWKVVRAIRAADQQAKWDGADRQGLGLVEALILAGGPFPTVGCLPVLAAVPESGGAAGQAQLARDVFGPPSRSSSGDPQCLTASAVAVARAVYSARDFSAMPILADVLQEAGCEDEQLLRHCRGIGPHVRGCWVLDWVLGRE